MIIMLRIYVVFFTYMLVSFPIINKILVTKVIHLDKNAQLIHVYTELYN